MGRKKKEMCKLSEELSSLNYGMQPIEHVCPTLHKVTTSNEMHLFDLSSIQIELERVLASVSERLQCLSAETKGKDIPPVILDSLRNHTNSNDLDLNQVTCGRSSLVVKSNPDKPLTLIISQRGRSIQSQQTSLPTPDTPTSTRKKSLSEAFGIRRLSRSFEENPKCSSPPSTDKNQGASSYVIPNKFWEMMEPYCAEITEANISYLESVIRSYQDIEANCFQHISLPAVDAVRFEGNGSPAPKRPRRESGAFGRQQQSPNQQEPPVSSVSASSNHGTISTKDIDADLKKPISESSMLGKLASSLLNTYIQDQLVSGFTDSVVRVGKELKTMQARSGSHEVPNDVDKSAQPSSNAGETFGNQSAAVGSNGVNPLVMPDDVRDWVTARSSQSFKLIAQQLHVCSSYRVEKKVLQAVSDLGLVPLNFIHPQATTTDSITRCDFHQGSLPQSPAVNRVDPVDVKNPDSDRSLKISLSTPKTFFPSTPPRSPAQTTLHVGRCHMRRRSSQIRDCSPDLIKKELSSITQPPPNRHQRRRGSAVKVADANGHPIKDCIDSREPFGRLSVESGPKKRGRKPRHIVENLSSPIVDQNGCATMDELNSLPLSDYRLVSPKLSVKEPAVVNGVLTDDEDNVGVDDFHETTENNKGRIDSNNVERVVLEEAPSVTVKFSKYNDDQLSHANQSPVTNEPTTFINGNTFTSNLPHEDHSDVCAADSSLLLPQYDANNHSATRSDYGGVVLTDATDNRSPASQNDCNDCKTTVHVPGLVLDNSRDQVLDSVTHPHGESHRSSELLVQERLPSNPNLQVSAPSFSSDLVHDEVGLAILRRQQELRVVCAENLSILRRLVQAARRDMQRQEIQRRLAIADADVIEAYNKLESYRPQRKPPLKRDRDLAYKALKERRKILAELDTFDSKSP